MRQVIVDKNDTAIGLKERDMLEPGDIYRVAVLWLTDLKNNVLMAQRAFTKKIDPGVWGPAVAGTVEESEEYDDNIVKEIAEEIGLRVTTNDLKKGPKLYIEGRRNDYFQQWYFYTIDKPAEDFAIQKDEVVQVRWFSPDELKQAVKTRPDEFVYAIPQWIDILLP